MSGDLIQGGEVRDLIKSRKLTAETCAKFGYKVAEHNGKEVQVAPYYDTEGNLVAQKVRTKDKRFSTTGRIDEALPFGATAFPKSGKMLTVTEGEIDAMSMSQVQGNKWPVVSIPNGASGAAKAIARNLEYFRGFDKVVLMFDSDEPGREAAQECALVLGSRAAIAELPMKDPNEMLKAGRTDELIDAMWKARQFQPEGIVDLASLKDAVKAPVKEGLSWWSPALTKMTYGIRLGEIHAFGAGTGIGKTDLFTQQMAHLALVHNEPLGVFALEQKVVETARRIAGKIAQRTFHIPDSGWTEEDLDSAWDKLQGKRIFLYDSFGVNEWDSIADKIEFLAHTEGVRYFFLDHLTALAASGDEERGSLEEIMKSMGSLVARLEITIFLVSHLATPEGKPHEEGGRVTIRHFKGSRAIGYWSAYMYGLERNQQAEDETERHTTTLRVLKDRHTGRAVGQCVYLGYDHQTGMLFETSEPGGAAKVGFKDETEAPQIEGAPSDF